MHIGKSSDSVAKKYPPDSLMGKLRERKIIATLAAFAGSGVVIIEVAHHILVNHYHFPHQTVDICIVTLAGALLGTLIWQWFRGAVKRQGNVKVEVLVVPLIILLTLVIDLKFIFLMTGISANMLLIGIVALCLGITWIIFKSLQWAASVPVSEMEPGKVKPGIIEEKPASELFNLLEWNNSIVVLPFENISPEEGQDYFCDGMTEEIITDLSKIHSLRVISRNSAMMLKGTRKATKMIGSELNVQYVLEGSVRKAGDNLRITAQLIDAKTDTHLWAEKYSGTLEDVFDIQEKVSRLIADTLKIKLTLKENHKISERPIDNIQAYECWIKARQAIFDWTEDSLAQAARYLETGLEILGKNALLFAGQGILHMFYFNSGIKKEPRVLLEAENYFNKAFQLDPDVFLGNYGIGFTRHLQGNNKEAIRYLRKALDINPNNADSMRLLSYIYSVMIGNDRKAALIAKKSIEVDPLSPVNYLGPVFIHWTKGELDKALEACKKYYQMAPKNIHARLWYATMLAWNNHRDEASNLIEKNQKEYPDHTMTKFYLFFKYSFENRKNDAIQCLSDEFFEYAWHNEWYSWMLAQSFALLNEKSKSLRWLERMIDLGHCNYPILSKLDPFLENIRGEPRFKKLMERVKHEWENFEV